MIKSYHIYNIINHPLERKMKEKKMYSKRSYKRKMRYIGINERILPLENCV